MTDQDFARNIGRWTAVAYLLLDPLDDSDEPFDPYLHRVHASYALAGTWSYLCPHARHIDECPECTPAERIG